MERKKEKQFIVFHILIILFHPYAACNETPIQLLVVVPTTVKHNKSPIASTKELDIRIHFENTKEFLGNS